MNVKLFGKNPIEDPVDAEESARSNAMKYLGVQLCNYFNGLPSVYDVRNENDKDSESDLLENDE